MYATFDPATIWEVEGGATGASDTNGCGFTAGGSGTDYTYGGGQQVIALTSLNCTNATPSVCSASRNFVAADVKNIINFTGGTNVTTGRAQIASVAANSATLDKNVMTGAPAADGSGNLGGACNTIGSAVSSMVAQNRLYIKATATYSISSGITIAVGALGTNTAPPTGIFGYGTTRGDGTRPVIQIAGGNSGVTMFTMTNNGTFLDTVSLDCNAQTSSKGVGGAGSDVVMYNIKVANCKSRALDLSSNRTLVYRSEITGMLSPADDAIAGAIMVDQTYIHDNVLSTAVISGTTSGTYSRNVLANNSGAGVGIAAGLANHVVQNTIYNTGGTGITMASVDLSGEIISGNILSNNGGYGLQCMTTAGKPASARWDYNVFFGNSLGTRHFCDDGTATSINAVNAVAPWTNHDILPSSSPFTNAAGADYSLNNTAGAGAAVRGACLPGSIPGLSPGGYVDCGALQHLDSGGGGTVGFVAAQ